jgi:hypothetical protein
MSQFLRWTKEKVQYLQQHGKIRGFAEQKGTHSANKNSHKNKKSFPDRSKEKEWLSWNLPFWCNDHAVTLETEFVFHTERKWKFDYAIPALKIAVEYEGIFKKDKGRTGHTSITGVMRDVEKYNAAQLLGWRIIRVTAKDYTTVLEQLNAYVA